MRVALVPGALALLPEYASLDDPVADLRRAAAAAIETLGGRIAVVASSPGGERVGRALVAEGGLAAAGPLLGPAGERPDGVVVVANGSAKRTDRAPGHFDPRAEAFDANLRERIRSGRGPDPASAELAGELWADVAALAELTAVCRADPGSAELCYDAAPFGVAYFVATWEGSWVG